MIIFDQKKCIGICLKNKNKYVALAVADLRNDFARVSKSSILPEYIPDENDFCIVIEENTSNTCDPIADEGFLIKSEGGKIIISANGYLGTMWGIYTFSEKILGVDPCYLFNDLEIEKKDILEVEEIYIEDKPESFAFRGVFINDEDLLSGWKDGGGIRYLDYPYYNITAEKSVMKMVAETLLRLKFNLVIPASLLDIDNPPEKALADCVAERGIYITQHHIEPLGLSAFTFDNYLHKYNKEGKFSYIEYPEIIEEAWEFYANKWAEYDNVVWQIGLRGAGDRPVWQEDIPTDDELKKYGAFISKAYAKQTEIILKATKGKAKYYTSTLWMEGSKLMQKGCIDIPEGAITIFSDCGPNQMFGDEYDVVPRKKDMQYGIYYHVQYYGDGPHIAPQTGLDKIYYHIELAKSKGDNSYFILNASNIREFVFELKATAQMVWNFEKFSKTEYIENYCSIFGQFSNEVKMLISDYFDQLPEIDINKYQDKFFNYSYNNLPENIKIFILKEGLILYRGSVVIELFHKRVEDESLKDTYNELIRVIPKYEEICRGFEKIAAAVSEPLKKHIEVKWILFTKTLLYIYKWYVNVYEAKQYCDQYESEKMIESLNRACKSLEEYLSFRKCAEYGIFENWYRGDLKMNVKQYYYNTKRLLCQTPDF